MLCNLILISNWQKQGFNELNKHVKHPVAYSLLLRVKQVIAIAFIIGKIISFKVWIADRTYPLLPFFDFLHIVPSFTHIGLFAVSLLLLIMNVIFPSKNKLVGAFIVVEMCSILLDETRLQAWVYEYLLLLYPFVFLKKENNETQIIASLKWILIATYFWSGFYKWNNDFLLTVWKPISGIPIDSVWLKAGYIDPFLEMFFAVGLLFGKVRKAAVLGLIIMHVFILIVFGPFGMNYNVSIWPWNLCMIVLLGLLFLKEETQQITFVPQKLSWYYLVLILCIMPVSNAFGVWRNELSFKLYSGDTSFLYLCLPDDALEKVPAELQHEGIPFPFCNGSMLSTKTWAMKEMNVMPCSDERYLQKFRVALSTERFKGFTIHFWIHESPYDSMAIHEWK
jgi:hypothetical protein